MVLEGIVTTLSDDGSPNISPMGPEVDAAWTRLVLKPYQTSRTYANLKRTGQGVLHVTDDVELLARAAINRIDELPQLQPPQQVQGIVLANCCRWYEFEVTQLDDSQERTRIDCRIVHTGRVRDFFGFNRGKHAVVEAAILATRTAFLPANQILDELAKLHVLVDKTGSEQERRAFQLLQTFVSDSVYRSHLSSK